MPRGGDLFVKDGVVELWGFVMSEDEREAMRILAEGVPGVRNVVDHRSILNVNLHI